MNSAEQLDLLIAKAKETGVLTERLRIIKLLQPEVTRHYELGLEASASYLEQTIELIKGERK